MKKIIRILADFIDFWLCFIPGFCLSILLQSKPYVYADIINIFFVIFPFVVSATLWVYKDTILKNRSIGKKIMGLYIYDCNNEILQDKNILIQRNFYMLWLCPLSCFLIVTCNQSVGDQKYHTFVSSQI